ncbi:MAG: hypothetical protein MUO54_04205 [Anaerolineales bacterium]|nr:hypothetical protein [Anaerolineales bacterium]
MSKDRSSLIWGGILILAGVLFLLQEINILGNAWQYLWLILMAAGSAVFLWIYFTKKDQWWAIIPGLTLLGLSFSGFESILNIFPGSNLSGAVFLGCIGLAFWLVYLRRQDQWWAISPGGVLVTLAAVAGFEKILGGSEVIFFLGLAATFALVGVLPSQVDTRWAFIPAAILAVLGIALFDPFKSAMLVIWPVALVALGVYILFRNWK